MVNEQRWLILVFGLYFLMAVGYSLLMPIWEAPDEPAHYHLAWHRETYGEDPPPEMNHELHQPRGFYLVGRLVIRALNEIDPELTRYRRPKEYPFTIRKPERRFDWNDGNYRFFWAVYLLRWLNIIIGAAALWLNWKTYKQLAPSSLALAALAFTALMPQYLHIMSSINNDALGTLAGALLFYLVILFLKEASVWMGFLLIPLAISLPLTTKLTVLPFSAALLVILAWKWVFGSAQTRWLLYSVVLIVVGAGIFYLLFPEAVQAAWNEIEWRLFSLRENALTETYIRSVTSQIIWTYWGKVGWLAVGLPLPIIQFLTGFGVIGMGLQVFFLIRSRVRGLQLDFWLAIWLIAIFTVLAVSRNGLTTFATQGRLLFPAIGTLSLLMVAGWHNLLPCRIQRYLPLFVILLFLSCNLILWLTGVIPIYYQPFFD